MPFNTVINNVDHAIYAYTCKGEQVITLTNVDNFLFATKSNMAWEAFKKEMANYFNHAIQEYCDTMYFLNYRIIQTDEGISFDQTSHVQDFINGYKKDKKLMAVHYRCEQMQTMN